MPLHRRSNVNLVLPLAFQINVSRVSRESSPAANPMDTNQADGDDDEISFRISPVLEEKLSNHQLVGPKSKKSRIDVEEEDETAAEDEVKMAEAPKRTQRSIMQWMKKTPIVPSVAANTIKRTSNSSRGSSSSNCSERDISPKLSPPDPPSAIKRRGAKSPMVPASGSDYDASGNAKDPVASAARQRKRSTKAMKS